MWHRRTQSRLPRPLLSLVFVLLSLVPVSVVVAAIAQVHRTASSSYPVELQDMGLPDDTGPWVYATSSTQNGGVFLTGGDVYFTAVTDGRLQLKQHYQDPEFDASVAAMVGTTAMLAVSGPDPFTLSFFRLPSFDLIKQVPLPHYEEVPIWLQFLTDSRFGVEHWCYLVGRQQVVLVRVSALSVTVAGYFLVPMSAAAVPVDTVTAAAYSYGLSPPQIWLTLSHSDKDAAPGAILTISLQSDGSFGPGAGNYTFTYLQQSARNTFVLQPPDRPLQIVWQQTGASPQQGLLFVYDTGRANTSVVRVPSLGTADARWGRGVLARDEADVLVLVSGPVDTSMAGGFRALLVDVRSVALCGALDVNAHEVPAVGAALPDPTRPGRLVGALASITESSVDLVLLDAMASELGSPAIL